MGTWRTEMAEVPHQEYGKGAGSLGSAGWALLDCERGISDPGISFASATKRPGWAGQVLPVQRAGRCSQRGVCACGVHPVAHRAITYCH